MKSAEEMMEILEAYDLTGRFARRRRWSGVITRRWRTGLPCGGPLAARRLSGLGIGARWRTQAHSKLQAMGYEGSQRTTRAAGRIPRLLMGRSRSSRSPSSLSRQRQAIGSWHLPATLEPVGGWSGNERRPLEYRPHTAGRFTSGTLRAEGVRATPGVLAASTGFS